MGEVAARGGGGRAPVVAGGAVWPETTEGGAGVGGTTAAGPRIRYQAPAPPAAIRTVATSIIEDDEAEASVVGSGLPQLGQALTTVLVTLYWQDGETRAPMRHLARAKRPP